MQRNAITKKKKKTNSIKKIIDINEKQILDEVDTEILDQMKINIMNICFITF